MRFDGGCFTGAVAVVVGEGLSAKLGVVFSRYKVVDGAALFAIQSTPVCYTFKINIFTY